MIYRFWQFVKKHKWVSFTVACVVLLVVLANVSIGPASKPGAKKGQTQRGGEGWGGKTGEEDLANLAKAIKNRSEDGLKENVKNSADRVRDLEEELGRTRQALSRMDSNHTATLQALAALKDELTKLKSSPQNSQPENPSPVPISPQENGPRPHELDDKKHQEQPKDSQLLDPNTGNTGENPQAPRSPARVRTIHLVEDQKPAKKEKWTVTIPTGAFGKATLLTGVYAPINSDPLPVLLKIDSELWGPNRSMVPIREAYLIGKAQGDSNSVRAIIQLQALSLVIEQTRLVDGELRTVNVTKTFPVNGWVTDTDGVQGVTGKYIDRLNEYIGITATTSALGKTADALSQRNVTNSFTPLGGIQQTVTGNMLEFSGLQMGSEMMRKMSEVISKRADDIKAAVFTPNGKQVTIVFLQEVKLSDLDFTGQVESNNPFEGLDVHK